MKNSMDINVKIGYPFRQMVHYTVGDLNMKNTKAYQLRDLNFLINNYESYKYINEIKISFIYSGICK
jgi:hypothetical protein